MTANHQLLYRITELMLEHEQHILPVDLLFDDEQIGDFVKSIQIDSPYQQMLLEGVLTESVREEKLYVSFTVEGYFHYVLGELLLLNQTRFNDEEIIRLLGNIKLNGFKGGVEQFLIRLDYEHGISIVFSIVESNFDLVEIVLFPVSSFIKRYGVEPVLEFLLSFDNDIKFVLIEGILEVFIDFQNMAIAADISKIVYSKLLSVEGSFPLDLAIDCLPNIKHPHNEKLLVIVIDAIKGLLDEAEQRKHILNIIVFCSNAGLYSFVDELLSFFPEIENIQDSYALNGIGVYYNQIYQREKAVMLWQKAFDLIKDEQENFMELKSMLLYNLAIGEQDLKSKLEFYQKAFKLDSIIHGGFHRDIALDLIAIARVQTKLKDYTKSEDSLLRAMKIFTAIGDANTQLLYSSFGDLYEKKGEFDRALDWRIKDLENVIGRVGLDNVILVNKLKTIARTCENLGDDKRALLELNKARSILLKFPQLHAERAFIDIGIGRIYYYIDDSKNCVNYLETSLKLIQKMSIPFDARYSDNCYFILSSAYYKEGQFENAMDSVLKISNWDVGETDRNDLIENYELRANICYRLNNYEGAIDAYKKLLDLEDNPSKIAKFWNLIGGAYEHLSVYSMASEAYVQSMKYTTDKLRKSNACFRLGKVHKQMNNDQKSLMFLKRGFRLNRQPYFLVEMAEICSRMGQYREAANFFINAIRLAKKQSTDYKKDENLRTLVLKAQALVKNSSLSISLPKWTDLYDGSDDK